MQYQDVPTPAQALCREYLYNISQVGAWSCDVSLATLAEMVIHFGLRNVQSAPCTIEVAYVRLDRQGYATRNTYASPGAYFGVGLALWHVWVHGTERTETYYVRHANGQQLRQLLANLFRNGVVLSGRDH